jgi:ribosomal protein S12 methylthiotransferase
MAAQLEVAREVSESVVGREIRVLVEKPASERELKGADVSSWEHGLIRGEDDHAALKGKYMIARGEADAPDIDGRVYVRGHKLTAGEFARVRVIGHTNYDLIATPV